MGCISSKKEVDDIYPNVFQVMNVDEQGNRVNPGQLEITDFDLILYQNGKPPIKWPLRTLRRYGFDSEHFSFESGRRCPTGPGIYAFRCRRAEQLFSLLQSRIQIRTNGESNEDAAGGPTGQRDASYLESGSVQRSIPSARFSLQNGIPRLSSNVSASSSLGPLSPQSSTINTQVFPLEGNALTTVQASRPTSQNLYANEEVIACMIQEAEETNNNKSVEETISPPYSRSYANTSVLEALPRKDSTGDVETRGVPAEGTNHLYMNIIPGLKSVMPRVPAVVPSHKSTSDWEPEEAIHNYANFDVESILVTKTTSASTTTTTTTVAAAAALTTSSPTPTTGTKSLNYIVLDLEPCSSSSDPSKSPTSSMPPDSPRKPTGGYAAIDFKKTVALSHSVNPNFDNDSEGSRKTRHNSNINDLIGHTRNSSSVSD